MLSTVLPYRQKMATLRGYDASRAHLQNINLPPAECGTHTSAYFNIGLMKITARL